MGHTSARATRSTSRQLLALFAGLWVSAGAWAATFEVSDTATHGDWQTATLTRQAGGEQERHFRAIETVSYDDASLSVNATPGVCDLPRLEMRVAFEGQDRQAATGHVPARLRVDDKTLHSAVAEFFTEPANDGFYVHFYLDDQRGLLDDMDGGEQIFLGFEQGEGEPWYMIFSLDGAGAAMDSAQLRCQAALLR